MKCKRCEFIHDPRDECPERAAPVERRVIRCEDCKHWQQDDEAPGWGTCKNSKATDKVFDGSLETTYDFGCLCAESRT